MATRIVTVDDITGETLRGDEPVHFELDGVEYEIDLTAANRARLHAVFQPYIDASRRAHYRTTQLPKARPRKTKSGR